MLFAIPYPAIDPILVSFGPFAIRWYALAYIAGLVIGWRYCLHLASRPPKVATRQDIDDFLFWATLGVVLGGRLGYVLFYKPGFYLTHPAEIVAVWHGGMSFHGGALGMITAIMLFCWKRRINVLAFGDIIVCAVPIGLFFGRIANFINGELYGRSSDVPWAMVFPTGGPEPRHPSQLYEACLEGLILFAVLNLLARFTPIRQRPGALGGVFLMGYALARMIGELFREPDAFLGYFTFGVTMGQILSVPLLLIGLALFLWARPLRAPSGGTAAGDSRSA
ncbi:MAG TPA: prolipoprotein diacylglyceryl transferase [Stellaceae bacterium]|jgi:phosphatidylglycerol:prolipoprotein diacylglycerol transferase